MNDHQHLRERVDERVSKRGASACAPACAPACAYVYMRVPIRPYATDATRRLRPLVPSLRCAFTLLYDSRPRPCNLALTIASRRLSENERLRKKKNYNLFFSSICRKKHKMRVERVKFRN